MHRHYLLPLVLLAGLLQPFSSKAQQWELGVFFGGSNYSGELTHDAGLYLNETNLAGGLVAHFNLNEHWALRSNLYYGRISGDDANASSEADQRRNLQFRSEVFEASFLAQYYLRGYDVSRGQRNKPSPFVFGGVALYNFSPEAQVGEDVPQALVDRGFEAGQWVSLQELGTEGQNQIQVDQGEDEGSVEELYALTTISLPIGIGYKVPLGRNFSVALEAGTRITFTDYLDDISKKYPLITEDNGYQNLNKGVVTAYFADRTPNNSSESGEFRGDPTDNDWYHFAGITVTYTILPDRCFFF